MTLRNFTASQGRLPNFLLIGAMKAGTTSLYHYLQAHPQVFVPKYKAPEFFVAESNLRRGIDWYCMQFVDAQADHVAVGEASNAYAKYPFHRGVPERIAHHIPDVRLVYIVRDPIERIRSHYQHRVNERAEKLPFEEAVFKDHIYLNYSRYALQIEHYLEHFPREQMLVITAEDLRANRMATVRAVYEFLGVDPSFTDETLAREFYRTKDRTVRSVVPLWLRKGLKRYVPTSKRFKEFESNMFVRLARRYPSVQRVREAKSFMIPDDVRQRLLEHLRDDVQRLKRYMGPEFTGWGIA